MALNIMSRGCNLQLLSKEPVSSFFLSFLFFFFCFFQRLFSDHTSTGVRRKVN